MGHNRIDLIQDWLYGRDFTTLGSPGGVLAAPADMDALWEFKPPRWLNSVGASLALGVTETANVLHEFSVTEIVKITPRTDTIDELA